jgi:hypothetical protein
MKMIILALLAMLSGLAGTGMCEMVKIPAVEDVYLDIDNESVHNSEILRCAYDAFDSETGKSTTMSMLKFNISDLDMAEDDIGVLVLKVNYREKGSDEPAAVVLLPVDSGWSEGSSYAVFVNSLNSVMKSDSIDFGNTGTIFDHGKKVFAFDVSSILLKSDDDLISFLLISNGDTDYLVDFCSGETGEGPYLLVIPYPSEEEAFAGDGAMAGMGPTEATPTEGSSETG